MKRATFFFLLLLVIPSLVFSVNNAKINGQKEITITQLPTDIVFTCDLAQAGNKLAFEYYVDVNGDGEVGGLQEPIMEFFYVTDGIGWIRDPQDPDADFAGDETGKDGKLKTTFTIDADEINIPTGMTGIFKLVDENGSIDQVKITIQITPQPPFIQGKVTDATTGSPIQNVFVSAEAAEETNIGITDNNGDYKISVTNGTYTVRAMQLLMSDYQRSDSVVVTVSNNQSQTQNFALEPYTCFVTGKFTMENGTPVAGIMVMAGGDAMFNTFGGIAISDAQGDYRIGVLPGTVVVSPSYLINSQNDNWPKDHYVDPQADSLNVSEGQTVTSNFVFKAYTAFVTGNCSFNGAGLPEARIFAMAIDFTTFAMNFYETLSDQNGDYRLGVLTGTLSTLQAEKQGFDLSSPAYGYMQVAVLPGQTVTGKDFDFTAAGTVNSIAGNVTLSNGSPVSNVYVAAENSEEESPEGFLITHTDGSGNYLFENVLDGVTYREESDEQTGFREKVIIETKDKTKNPEIKIVNNKR